MIRELSTRANSNTLIAGDMSYPNINWSLMNNITMEEDKEFKFIKAKHGSLMLIN